YTKVASYSLGAGYGAATASCDTVILSHINNNQALVATLIGGRLGTTHTASLPVSNMYAFSSSCTTLALVDFSGLFNDPADMLSGTLKGGKFAVTPCGWRTVNPERVRLASTASSLLEYVEYDKPRYAYWGTSKAGVITETHNVDGL